MAVQNKQRAVVVVRKALDKLLADLEKVNCNVFMHIAVC